MDGAKLNPNIKEATANSDDSFLQPGDEKNPPPTESPTKTGEMLTPDTTVSPTGSLVVAEVRKHTVGYQEEEQGQSNDNITTNKMFSVIKDSEHKRGPVVPFEVELPPDHTHELVHNPEVLEVPQDPALEQAHDPDVPQDRPALEQDHDQEVPQDPALEQPHNPDVPQDPALQQAHDPDVPQDPALEQAHDQEVPRDPALEQAHNPDVPQDPILEQDHDPDVPQDPVLEQAHDPDIPPVLERAHDPDVPQDPVLEQAHNPDVHVPQDPPLDDPEVVVVPEDQAFDLRQVDSDAVPIDSIIYIYIRYEKYDVPKNSLLLIPQEKYIEKLPNII